MSFVNRLMYLNGEIRDAANALVSPISASALYGKGIFTTIAIYNGKPFLWEKHWRRLSGSAAKIGIDVSEYGEQRVASALADLIEKNGLNNGRARITFFDESPGSIWGFDSGQKTSLLITTADFRPLPEHFKLTISPYRINTSSPLAGIKSCNYLEQLMSFDEAKSRSFDEAIRLNEHDEIASACMANVFWLKNEKLYTPSLKTGCLAGTTREQILENVDCEEVESGIEALQDADALYLSSAGIGIQRIGKFEERSLLQVEHPFTKLLFPRFKV
ncbi:MAG: aminotransferase class IV [Blastocatellia bacterium]